MNTYTAKAAFNGEEYTDTVTVQMFIYGDVNGDGRIDGRDLIRLRKYLATYNDDTGTGDVEIFAGADMNGDGVVNGKDLIRLRKYLVTNDNNVSNDAPLIADRVIPLIITSVPDKRFMQIK